MKVLIMLVLFGQTAFAVKHSLKYLLTRTSNMDFPYFMGSAEVDNIHAGYCDSKTKTVKPRQDWVTKLFAEYPNHLAMYEGICRISLYNNLLSILELNINQTKAVQIVQSIEGCEWDEITGELTSILQYAYDGEDFISLDVKKMTWVTHKPQALITKIKWDAQERIKGIERGFTQICFARLQEFLQYGQTTLQRTDPPSVSLLQKTFSSVVICHATGFYPDRAMMFWRKDGEEIHEDVEHGELLPNHDGTFQMIVVLNVSSAEAWRRYDCVFQFDGAKESIITKLDKTLIRTNKLPKQLSGSPVGWVFGLLLLLPILCILGYYNRKRIKNGFQQTIQ